MARPRAEKRSQARRRSGHAQGLEGMDGEDAEPDETGGGPVRLAGFLQAEEEIEQNDGRGETGEKGLAGVAAEGAQANPERPQQGEKEQGRIDAGVQAEVFEEAG